MTALVTRAEALHALLVAPFIVVLLIAVVVMVAVAFKTEEPDYTRPWEDRSPGVLPEQRDRGASS